MQKKTELNNIYWRQLKDKTSIAGISLDESISYDDFSTYGDRLANKQMWMFEQNSDQPLGQASVLDVGCGIGRILRPFSERFDSCIGIDINPQILAAAKDYIKNENVKLIENDGLSIPFDAYKFHFVYSGGVLQHIPDIKVILNYFYEGIRVLKVGGVLNFSVQVCMTLRQGGIEGDRVGAQILASDIESLLNETGAELKTIYFDEKDPVPHYNILIKKVDEDLAKENIERRKKVSFKIDENIVQKINVRTGLFEDLESYSKFRDIWFKKSNNKVTFFNSKSGSCLMPFAKYYAKSILRLVKKRG
jgi:ubiquinone/menaquinone biosynthesis C-methylase UbiE